MALALALIPAGSSPALQTEAECQGLTPTLIMTEPGDFEGTKGPDIIQGSFGDDSIRGRGGKDIICGESGNDHLNGGKGADELYGEFGSDLLRGRRGQDLMDGKTSGNGGGGKRGQTGFDQCHGGSPRPDTPQRGDVAFNCNKVFNALEPKIVEEK